MEYENERVLKLIFPEGIPDSLKGNPALDEYLFKLGTYKVEQLKKEQIRLGEENKSVVEHTQDLAITNYKTFIQTSECSRHIFQEFKDTEQKLDYLIEKLPDLTIKCEEFIKKAGEINQSKRLNGITFKKGGQLLEILELPKLMDTFIREGKYEEALELAAYVQRLGTKHNGIPVINSIVLAIEESWHTMLKQLLNQLKSDLQLPKCLQVVGYLRRMQAFLPSELRIVFLQSRDCWLNKILGNIPKDDPQVHLTKTIELTRVNMFTIITQYKATFTDDDNNQLVRDTTSTATGNVDDRKEYDDYDFNNYYYSWLNKKIEVFLETLEYDLQQGIESIDTVLGQCMYFGLSFSRVGADFRGLMVPIFTKIILNNFQTAIFRVNQQFEKDMEQFTLINKITTSNSQYRNLTNVNIDNHLPPESLLDFYPLAIYCNGILTGLNELRHCCPIALLNDVTNLLQSSLENVSKNILHFYRQEQQAFGSNEKENFVKFCSIFAYDLIPYIQRCIHVLFPPDTIATHLGINVITLQKEGLSYLKQKQALSQLERLLPTKVESVLMQHTNITSSNIEQLSTGDTISSAVVVSQ